MNTSRVTAARGRRYCFVAMTFQNFTFYEWTRRLVADTGFECIRADDEVPERGINLWQKVQSLIEGAALVIADISDENPNVHIEVGYAVACNKPLVLLVREGSQVPTDLRGFEVIQYKNDRSGLLALQEALRQQIAKYADPLPLMLPADPKPTFILLNPKWPDAVPPTERQQPATYGDYRAVLWISTAIASVFGEGLVPELVNASLPPADPHTWNANLYVVGSPKVNQYSQTFLDDLQCDRVPRWGWQRAQDHFGIVGTSKGERPFPVMSKGCFESEPYVDYGLLMRGPHPRYPNRIVTVIAGPRSLGTLAACMAATRSDLVRNIANSCDLTDRSQTIWALVKGVCHRPWHVDPDEVVIVDAGVCRMALSRSI